MDLRFSKDKLRTSGILLLDLQIMKMRMLQRMMMKPGLAEWAFCTRMNYCFLQMTIRELYGFKDFSLDANCLLVHSALAQSLPSNSHYRLESSESLLEILTCFQQPQRILSNKPSENVTDVKVEKEKSLSTTLKITLTQWTLVPYS